MRVRGSNEREIATRERRSSLDPLLGAVCGERSGLGGRNGLRLAQLAEYEASQRYKLQTGSNGKGVIAVSAERN